MKRILSSVVLLITAVFCFATPRTADEALLEAHRFIKTSPSFSMVSNMKLTLASDIAARTVGRHGMEMQVPAYYIVNIESGNGFVVISGDDRFVPILGFSTDGNVVEDKELPDGLFYWLGFLSDEMAAAVNNGYADIPAKDMVNEYAESVEPLLTSKWGQTSPFNNKIPNYATGCVATGMAQVMNFWKYPVHGTGSHTHIYNNVYYTADFGVTTYDWANMKDTYGDKFDTKAQVDAVSTLMLHLGIATDMQWTKDNSGTPNMYSAYAFTKFFCYNPNLYCEGRDYLSLGAWKALVLEQLYTGHPLPYSGFTQESSGAGHYFVLDGYDAATNLFHFNWGWAGAYDGYFALSALEPGGEGQVGALTGTFNYNQQMFVDVQPTKCGEPTAHFDARDVYPVKMSGDKSNVIIRTIHLTNNTVSFTGSIGLAIYDEDGGLCNFIASSEPFPGNLLLGNSYTQEFDVKFNLSAVTDGTYTVCLAVQRDDMREKPFPVRAYYGHDTYYNMNINGSNVTFAKRNHEIDIEAVSAPILLDAPAEGTLYENSTAHFQVCIRNAASTEFYDEVGICIKKNRDSNPQFITTPCRLAPGEEKTVIVYGKVMCTPSSYKLCACYGDNGEYVYLTDESADVEVVDGIEPLVIGDEEDCILYTPAGVRIISDVDTPSGIYIRNKRLFLKK